MIALAVTALLIAALPAMLFLANVRVFLPPPPTVESSSHRPSISVLIPARNEAAGIRASVSAVLASEGCDVEVVVLDDQSSDTTRSIVTAMAAMDSRVRCIDGAPPPTLWNGKQYACYQLASVAVHPVIVFLDADVRLATDALTRLASYRAAHQVDLLSAFPHQETGTWLEKWLIPMMHYLLLGYLPFARMRSTRDPSLAAGCGQLFLTTSGAYRLAGTHESIAGSRHDGIKLPRAYRAAGLVTDVVDGTALAECRMYTSAGQVVRGLLKNANEGIAQPRLIGLFTVLLIGGSVLPILVLIAAILLGQPLAAIVAAAGVILGHLPRGLAAIRFRQPLAGVIFHSLAVTVFVMLQWVSLTLNLLGQQIAWRGRK